MSARPAMNADARDCRRPANAGRSSRARFIAVGLDHTTARIELREQLAFADAEIPSALQRLTDPTNRLLDQAAILSTCNRIELYGVAPWRPDLGQLASFLACQRGLDTSAFTGALCVYRDDEVAQRLAATAAGMHSLVLGEPQIQGQTRKALELALSAGTAGAELRRLFESAIAAGRQVRSQTAIGRGVASVPQVSVELGCQRLGSLSQSTVLLIGTGETGELVAKQLVKRGAQQLLVLGRAPARANRLAASYGGRAITPERLDDALARSDLVISVTGSPHPVLHRDHLRRAVERRSAGSTPLLLIDLSVPRDVEPAAGELSGLELVTIDDLRSTVGRALAERRAELPRGNAIVASEVARFTAWLRRRETRARRLTATLDERATVGPADGALRAASTTCADEAGRSRVSQ